MVNSNRDLKKLAMSGGPATEACLSLNKKKLFFIAGNEVVMVVKPNEGGRWLVDDFCGIRDGDGKRIFESDTVRVLVDGEFVESYHEGIVRWNDSDLCWYVDFGSVSLPLIRFKDDCYITGNLRENPEWEHEGFRKEQEQHERTKGTTSNPAVD